MSDARVIVRGATVADVGTILGLIRELAEFERLSQHVVATERDLGEALFGPDPVAEVLLAESGSQAVGYALFFKSFSTFVGRAGVYLEDLYVKPAYRRRGIGKSLFARVAEIANERNYGRMEWAVLDWNRSAIDFYEQMGAVPLSEWTTYRLTGKALTDTASKVFPVREQPDHIGGVDPDQ